MVHEVHELREHEPADAEMVRPHAADPRSGVAAEPGRAWLIRVADDLARSADREPTPEHGFGWRMFLEGGRDTVDLDGTFEALVARAVTAGVVELHVWSRSQRTYLPFSPMTVRVPD